MIRVANAPVSFGIFEVRDSPPPLSADEMVAALAEAGYTGIDLGPIGYLGTGAELVERLERAGFLLAGGWADLRYGDAEAFKEGIPALEATLDVFEAAPSGPREFAPVTTLGCPGSPERFARPGGSVPGLAASDWPGYAAHVQEAADICRSRGFEPAFHHHLGTYVETVDDIERLLELTDVQLCLDTGHLLLAGGDPVKALREWSGRIGHVHIKDGSRELFAEGGDLRTMMGRGVFPALGDGDLDLPGVVQALDDTGYAGWVIVEQDTLPGHRATEDILADQVANRQKLKELGL